MESLKSVDNCWLLDGGINPLFSDFGEPTNLMVLQAYQYRRRNFNESPSDSANALAVELLALWILLSERLWRRGVLSAKLFLYE